MKLTINSKPFLKGNRKGSSAAKSKHMLLLQRTEVWFPAFIQAGSQPPANPVPGDLIPSSRRLRLYTHVQNQPLPSQTHMNIQN